MADIQPHNPLEGDRPDMTFKLHDGSEEQVSIIIVHRNSPEYLNICLQSIVVASLNSNFEIIVVDNASGTDSQDFLNDIKDEVKIIKNTENLYWAAAANKGAQAASPNSKYFIFMHSDVVILNPAWIDLLINVLESGNDSSFVGLDMQSYYMQNQKIDFVQEWLCLMTRECWEDAGPYEERLPQVGSPFIFTVRAQRKGHKPQVMRNPIAHHYRIFGIDINEHERLTEQAMVEIPKILREIQGQ